MICLEFPPVNTTGNYRSAGFARYLSSKGLDVSVLTADIESGIKTFGKGTDQSLMNGLENVDIYRFPIKPLHKIWNTKLGNAFRIWWNTTDNIAKRWYFGKNKTEINKIIRTIQPKALYVSLPPFSISRVAIEISKKFKIPLITDMRDAWSLWATSAYSTRFHYYHVKKMEHDLFNQSQCVISVTNEIIEDFKNQHKNIHDSKFYTIFNGYDEISANIKIQNEKNRIFKIGYVGSFYYDPKAEEIMHIKWHKRKGYRKFWYVPRKEVWKYRSPYYFLKTLAELKKTDFSEYKVVFEYVGNTPGWLNDMINQFGLSDSFVDHGFKTKSEVLSIQQSWNAILATSEKIIDGKHFCLPSKTFDYINSGKPLFAFITEGSQLSFFNNYKQITLFDPDEIENNVTKLKQAIILSTESEITPIDHFYSRENQSRLLYKLLSDNIFNKF